jgi:AraC family transcriptional regulator
MSLSPAHARETLLAEIGRQVLRFQAGTSAVDHIAARVLGLQTVDVAVLAALWFGGPAAPSELCVQLDLALPALQPSLDRLTVTGYTLRVPGTRQYAPTLQARRWIDTIWGPLGAEGEQVAAGFSERDLAVVGRFLGRACETQEAHAARLRGLLSVSASARGSARGGLSPAALRREELFVEANLSKPIRLKDLAARADLSEFHFARAFKVTTHVTPRAYIEQCRIEAAQELIRHGDASLAQVAIAAGFGSQSRLTTTFRKWTGLTPARYREQQTASPRRKR